MHACVRAYVLVEVASRGGGTLHAYRQLRELKSRELSVAGVKGGKFSIVGGEYETV